MLWVSPFRSLQVRDTAVFTHSNRPPAGRRASRYACQAASAVTDAPVKRKPGRPKKSATEKPEAAAAVAENSDPAHKQNATRQRKPRDPEVAEEESESVDLPPPWAQLTPAQIEQQNAELATLGRPLDGCINHLDEEEEMDDEKWLARQSEDNKFLYRDPEWVEMEEKVFTKTESGWKPDFGCFGEGKLHWYSLNIKSAKKMKDVALFLTNEAGKLPGLESSPDEPRTFETWLPSKLIKNYNWRTEKMGNKTIKWKYGEKLLVQAVMDKELYYMIAENYFVGGHEFPERDDDRKEEKLCYEFSETVHDRKGEEYVIPKPCPEEYIESIRTWLDTPEVRGKEEVMMDEFGEAVKLGGSMSGASNRVDMDEEYVEVFEDDRGGRDKKGRPDKLRSYKDDSYRVFTPAPCTLPPGSGTVYKQVVAIGGHRLVGGSPDRGSFSNPSNWFSGQPDDGDTGSTSQPAMGSRVGTGQDRRAGSRVPWQDTVSSVAAARESQNSKRVSTSHPTDTRPMAGPRGRAAEPRGNLAGLRGRGTGSRDTFSGPRGRAAESRDSNTKPPASDAPASQESWSHRDSSVPEGRSVAAFDSRPDGSRLVAGTSPAGNKLSGPKQAEGTQATGPSPSQAAQEADPMPSDGRQWEPTGKGRKAWYNPQSSSASDATAELVPSQVWPPEDLPSQGLPSEVLPKPTPSSRRQSKGTSEGAAFQRKATAFRNAQRESQRPAVPSGDQQLPVGDQQVALGSWQKWQDGPSRPDAAYQEEEAKGGRPGGWLPPGSGSHMDRSSSHVDGSGQKGGVRKAKLKPRISADALKRPGEAGSTRGVVRPAQRYDPVRKFQPNKLHDNIPNFFHEVKEDDGNFEMPSFENMDADVWNDESLQFNNAGSTKSESNLDEWRSNADGIGAQRGEMDWPAWGRAVRRQDLTSPSGTAPADRDNLPNADLAKMSRNKRASTASPPQSSKQTSGVIPSHSSSSAANSPSSSASEQNPFAEGGEFDEWGTRSPALSPRSGQQPTDASSDQRQPSSRQSQVFQKPPQQSTGVASSSSDSWSTDDFDFADMDRDMVNRQARYGQDRQQTPQTRRPPASRHTSQQQSPPRQQDRGNSAESRPGRAQSRAKPNKAPTNTSKGPENDKDRNDFDTFWNDF